MRNRGRWLEVATLLGAIAPFLPFWWFWRDFSLVDYLTDVGPPDASFLLVPPAFLPVFIVVWLWRRRYSSVPTTSTWPAVARVLAIAAMTSSAVGSVGMQGVQGVMRSYSDLGWTAAFFLPIVVNLGLWWRNHRRQRPLDATSEVLLLGTYVATTLPWTLWFLVQGGAVYGAWLIAGVDVAYVVAIVMRLRTDIRPRPGRLERHSVLKSKEAHLRATCAHTDGEAQRSPPLSDEFSKRQHGPPTAAGTVSGQAVVMFVQAAEGAEVDHGARVVRGRVSG